MGVISGYFYPFIIYLSHTIIVNISDSLSIVKGIRIRVNVDSIATVLTIIIITFRSDTVLRKNSAKVSSWITVTIIKSSTYAGAKILATAIVETSHIVTNLMSKCIYACNTTILIH